ncbi:MAG: gluconokinase [Cyclobacteriaceae bacterium]|nr:gluconokinase [Cyclobacteriaceae bacterium]
MKYILAVDIGTTSAKALVVSQKGEVLANAQEFYTTQRPIPDYAEQDAEVIFQAVKKIIKMAADKVNGKVDAVSFSTAMHSLMGVDKNGEALTPLIIWADLRSKNEAIEIINNGGQKIYEETGTPIHSMSPLCKLRWIKKNQPQIAASAFKFIGIKEYIWGKFFHEFIIDDSIASATGLFNIATRTWSHKAVEMAGISVEQLSTPCSPLAVFENPSEDLAKELGLPASVQWVMGASDGCLANLGSGAMDEKTLSLTIGTSGAVRKAVTKNTPDAQGRSFNYLLNDKTIITGGATNNGAILVQWFAEKFLKEKVNVKTFGERASGVVPGSAGLIFLPFVLGERAPVFDPESSGVFIGVRQRHTTEHFMRAILEGVGYSLLSIAEVVEENSGSFEKVIASGGFIKSPHWVQIIADIFGKEFTVRGTEDASALGAALIGFEALKVESDFQFPNERVFNPDMILHKKYQQYFSVYKNLYPHLASDFHSLNQIANS